MIINWITNSKMEELLKSISVSSDEEGLKMNFGQLKKLLFPPFKRVNDCVIISEKSVDKLEATFDKAIEFYMDKTGYEASNTETRINCYFENNISMKLGTKIALIVLEVWILQLKKMEPESDFCMIISCDEESVEIRFHKIHKGKIMWLDENLDNYKDGAIGYAIV